MKFNSDFKLEWNELKRFEGLTDNERSIVFYVENEYYYIYLKSILQELIKKYELKVCYVTSSKSDPLLKSNNENLKSFYIGEGAIRTKFFLNLKADILVMTMPDLQTFHIKRSKVKKVNYVYVFHSTVSTHLVYRKDAFDNFDTILCTGNYQIKEILERESKENLDSKKLIKCGYPRLDDLIFEYNKLEKFGGIKEIENQILVAPSWGENGLIETKGEQIVNVLLDADFKVILRPHPMTIKKSKKTIQRIKEKFSQNSNFQFEEDISTFDSFFSSQCVISDWSGVSLEYAFTTKKPILFMDVPKKMRNANYKEISYIPLEITIRDKIGKILSTEKICDLPERIHEMKMMEKKFVASITNLHEELIFNVGNSAKIGAEQINELIEK